LTLQQAPTTSSTNLTTTEIENGLNFIIEHFDPTILYFPRTIMTKKSNGQIVIYAKEEALQYFKESEFKDCRINAFRYSSSINSIEQWIPDLLFIDIDKSDFKSDRSCKLALSNTLKNIQEKLGGNPTVLFTGGGYHIYQPIEGIIFQNSNDIFDEFNNEYDLFNEFLRFSKSVFSNNKADKNNNPSLKSCLLRIPGSINSKYDRQVKIIRKWNGVRVPIPREIIEDFRTHLIQKKIDAYNYRQKIFNMRNKNRNNNSSYVHYYEWIDKKILANPFPDYRKLIINLILTPYLVVIKKLSYEDSSQIIKEWLQKCNLLRKLDFNARSFVNSAIATADKKQIPPMRISTLKKNYNDLYLLLLQKRKIEKEGRNV
jgi:Primase X